MFAFAGMLIAPAHAAGMKYPSDADHFDKSVYPHFEVFRTMQLGRAMPYPACVWDNAKIIASIPEDKIRSIMFEEILALGYQ